jgi:hypothetical protein
MSSLMAAFPDVTTRNMVDHDYNDTYNDSPKWFIAVVTTLVAVPVLVFVGYFFWQTLLIITKCWCRGHAYANLNFVTNNNINGDINDDNSMDDIKQMNGSFRLKQRAVGHGYAPLSD